MKVNLSKVPLVILGLLFVAWGFFIWMYGWNSMYERVETYIERGQTILHCWFPWEKNTPYTYFVGGSMIVAGTGFIFLVLTDLTLDLKTLKWRREKV